jgi:hypothetical protein
VARRFLLDQNFPSPITDMSLIDAMVKYVPVEKFDASLTRKRTPDWVIYLRAAEDGFAGVVTRDANQLEQAEEMVVLANSELSVVTWQRPVEDPLQEWGQLIAYMPLVVRRLDGGNKGIFLLPRPSLGKDNIRSPRDLLGEMASKQGRSYPEVRAEALTNITAQLHHRGLARLLPLLRELGKRAET